MTTSTNGNFIIRMAMFPRLLTLLNHGKEAATMQMTEELWKNVNEIFTYVRAKKLKEILATQPESDITIVEGLHLVTKVPILYACWKKSKVVPGSLKKDLWLEIMGPVKDQGEHDICWAIVTAEMVSAIRYIKRFDKVKTEYSIQDVVDFTNPEKRGQEKQGHYCYPWYVHKGLEYVSRAGIQREEARPFHQFPCEKDVPPRNPVRLGYIREAVQLNTIEEALVVLHEHPVASGIPLFIPEYAHVKDEIYRGPTAKRSRFRGLHAVTIIGADEENGEKYVCVRSSHGKKIGKDGNLKVSIEIMIVCLTPPGCVDDPFYPYMYYPNPKPLLSAFTYPTLLSMEEENVLKKKEACPGSWIIDIIDSRDWVIDIDSHEPSAFTYPTLLSMEAENVRKKNEACPGSWIIDIIDSLDWVIDIDSHESWVIDI